MKRNKKNSHLSSHACGGFGMSGGQMYCQKIGISACFSLDGFGSGEKVQGLKINFKIINSLKHQKLIKFSLFDCRGKQILVFIKMKLIYIIK